MYLAVAAGRHIVEGHLVASYYDGTNVYFLVALATGVWDSVEGIWYRGKRLSPENYHFLDGSQTAPSAWFPDFPAHTGTVMLAVKLPQGAEFSTDTKANPPVQKNREDLGLICKCEKFPDWDMTGNQIVPLDYAGQPGDLAPGAIVATPEQPINWKYITYTVSPARVLAGWYFKYQPDPLRSDINWQVWTAWKAYCATLETIDYTTLDSGYGLTARYYIGTNFEQFQSQRVDPAINFNISDGAPAAGLPLDNFSARWTGEIEPEFTEAYTFKIIHDNGARLWVNGVQLINLWTDDGQTPAGASATSIGTIELTAGQFYDIKVEWNEGGGPGEFRLFWSSASQPEEIIPYKRLYPEGGVQENYQCHSAFTFPSTINQMIDQICLVTNTLRQDVNEQMEFRCVEQLESQFHFKAGEFHIIDEKIAVSRSDRRRVELNNVLQARFRDLDSQFLEEPQEPVVVRIDELIEAANGREIPGDVIDLGSCNRWTATKILNYKKMRSVLYDQKVTFKGTARTYTAMPNGLVTVTHPRLEIPAKKFFAVEVKSHSGEQTAQTKEYKLQEWVNN